ncbi:MAG TPA: PilZ domain-containing protein [Myxococcota bacterium]|nr:PilZ domain-containing protein [Myxococcota bacterium]
MELSEPYETPRSECRARFEGWVELRSGATRRRAAARDLSVRGMGLSLSGPLPARLSSVVSEFALPGITLPLALEGVVVWTNAGASRLGIRFAEIDPGLAELLSSYVAGRL